MFASIYFALLNDIYGRKVAKRAVWIGFSSTLVMIVMQLSLHFTPSPIDSSQQALESIFNLVPRIALSLDCLHYRPTFRRTYLL